MLKNLLSRVGRTKKAGDEESIAQLRDDVMARLKGEPEVVAVRPDPKAPAVFEVELSEASGSTLSGTVDVTNVHGRLYVLRIDSDRAAAIDNLANSLLASARRPELDLARVFANVRFAGAPASGPAGRAPNDKVAEPLAGDLAVVFQLDTPSSLIGLSYEDLGDTPLEVVKRAARENIVREMANLVETPTKDNFVLFQLAGNDALASAIVLADEFWERVSAHFPDGALLILRRRDEVVVIDRHSPDAMGMARKLIEIAKQQGVDFLSDHIFERRDRTIVALEE